MSNNPIPIDNFLNCDSHSAVAICTNSPPFTDRGHGAPNALGTLWLGKDHDASILLYNSVMRRRRL